MRLGGRPGPPLAASSKMRLAVAPLFTFLPCTCPTSALMDPHLATIFFNLLPSAARCPLPLKPLASPRQRHRPQAGTSLEEACTLVGRHSLVAGQAFTNITTPPAPPCLLSGAVTPGRPLRYIIPAPQPCAPTAGAFSTLCCPSASSVSFFSGPVWSVYPTIHTP